MQTLDLIFLSVTVRRRKRCFCFSFVTDFANNILKQSIIMIEHVGVYFFGSMTLITCCKKKFRQLSHMLVHFWGRELLLAHVICLFVGFGSNTEEMNRKSFHMCECRMLIFASF